MSKQAVSKRSQIGHAWAPWLSEGLFNESMDVVPEKKYSTFGEV